MSKTVKPFRPLRALFKMEDAHKIKPGRKYSDYQVARVMATIGNGQLVKRIAANYGL